MLQAPNVCRAGHRCDPETIDDAINCTAMHADIPAKAIADAIGMSRGFFYAAVDPQRQDVHLNPGRLLGFMRAVGSIAPLQFMAAALGYRLVKLPAGAADVGSLGRKFLTLVAEVGEDSAAIERALADGRIDRREARRLLAELDDTIEAAENVRAEIAVLAEATTPARMTIGAPQRRETAVTA